MPKIKSFVWPANSVCKQTIQIKLPWYICLSILFLCFICLLSRRLKRASVYYTNLKWQRTNILPPITTCVQHNLVQYGIISLSMKQTHSISWTTKLRTLDERKWKWTVSVYCKNPNYASSHSFIDFYTSQLIWCFFLCLGIFWFDWNCDFCCFGVFNIYHDKYFDKCATVWFINKIQFNAFSLIRSESTRA